MARDPDPSSNTGVLTSAMDRRTALRAGGVLAALLMSGAIAGPAAGDAGLAPLFRTVGDIIIPPTATPGGGSADAFIFVSRAVERGILGAPANLLQTIKRELDRRAGGDFLSRSASQRLGIVTALDTESFGANVPIDGAWLTYKALVLVGYYTSEAGGSKELDYELVPGRYDPDVPIGPGHKALSNDWPGLSIRKGAMKT